MCMTTNEKDKLQMTYGKDRHEEPIALSHMNCCYSLVTGWNSEDEGEA